MYNTNMTGMQQQAQAALPVIPNNGNPRGVYNMPQRGMVGGAEAPPAMPQAPVDKYAWLKPSVSLQNVRATSQRIQQNVQATKPQQATGLVPPIEKNQASTMAPPAPQGMYEKAAPVLPMAAGAAPILPERTEVGGHLAPNARPVLPNRLVRQQAV